MKNITRTIVDQGLLLFLKTPPFIVNFYKINPNVSVKTFVSPLLDLLQLLPLHKNFLI